MKKRDIPNIEEQREKLDNMRSIVNFIAARVDDIRDTCEEIEHRSDMLYRNYAQENPDVAIKLLWNTYDSLEEEVRVVEEWIAKLVRNAGLRAEINGVIEE